MVFVPLALSQVLSTAPSELLHFLVGLTELVSQSGLVEVPGECVVVVSTQPTDCGYFLPLPAQG